MYATHANTDKMAEIDFQSRPPAIGWFDQVVSSWAGEQTARRIQVQILLDLSTFFLLQKLSTVGVGGMGGVGGGGFSGYSRISGFRLLSEKKWY